MSAANAMKKQATMLGQTVATVLSPTVRAFTPLPHLANKTLLGDDTATDGWSRPVRIAVGALGTIGMVAGVYHGYKRNNSVGWAIGWGLLGGIFPVVTIPLSLAQGFGKRKGR